MVGLSFESGFRLFVVETLIECIAGIKFRVCATGNDLPAIENEDSVGVLNRTEAVGDDEYRAPFGELLECRLNLVLALGVKRGGRLVQDNDGCVLEEGTSDGNTLALPAG